MNTIAVYGTLKEGNLNGMYYLKNATMLGVEVIKGYQLYVTKDNLDYPIVVPEEGSETYFEIYTLPDNDFQAIKKMEERVGYIEVVEKTEFGIAKIFIMPTKNKVWSEKYLTNNWNQSIN